MAKLWLMAALLLLVVPAGSSVNSVTLAEMIKRLTNKYKVYNSMFCLAVSIPNLDQVVSENPAVEVKKQVEAGSVYKGNRLVVAKLLPFKPGERHEHAEYRVLKDLKLESKPGDLLVIYSYASSCPGKCTKMKSEQNIIKKINTIVNSQKWGEKVFVFEKVFKPNEGTVTEAERIKALQNLGTSRIPLKNIFRCYKTGGSFKCTSCCDPVTKSVNPVCYTYDPEPSPSPNAPSTLAIEHPGGKANPPSQKGQKKKKNNNDKNPGGSTNVDEGGRKNAGKRRG